MIHTTGHGQKISTTWESGGAVSATGVTYDATTKKVRAWANVSVSHSGFGGEYGKSYSYANFSIIKINKN